MDGYYVGTESPCPVVAPSPSARSFNEQGAIDLCAAGVRAAELDLVNRDPIARIVAAAMASVPTFWVGSDGRQHGMVLAGLARQLFVVVDLASGERHTVPVTCMADVDVGTVWVKPASCEAIDGSAWRVGAPPPPF